MADQDGQTLDRLVSASDAVLSVTADHQEDLEQTLDKLPDTLKVGRKTLAALSDTADEAAPTLDALEPFTEDLPEISEEMEEFADALDPALATSRPCSMRPTSCCAKRDIRPTTCASDRPELAAAVGGTKTLVNGLTVNRDKVFAFIRNWALNTNGFDGISHYWRIVVTVHPDSWTALLDMLGGGQLPGLPAAGGQPAASAAGISENGGSARCAEVVNGVTKPLTGLTDKLTGGTLLQGEKSGTGDGSSTGLNEKQESGLLGFLFGGGE